MSSSSIGDFTFLEMLNPPDVAGLKLSARTRPGVNGASFWSVGTPGVQVTVQTRVDTADLAAAVNLFQTYKGQIGNSLALTYRDVDYSGFTFMVMDVRPLQLLATAGPIVGGINGGDDGSLGWCHCEWDLWPIVS